MRIAFAAVFVLTMSRPAFADAEGSSEEAATLPSDDEDEKNEDPTVTDLLTFHKENYVITGFTGNTQVKVQFSAKYDIWPNESHHAVHFGFTAKALWNVYRPSSPFVETNYNPELFYTFFHHLPRYTTPRGCSFFHERAGLEHDSNGVGGIDSRSWNRVYVESRVACYSEAGPFGAIALKVWAPPFGIDDNPGIVGHLGYGELKVNLGAEGRSHWWGEPDLTLVLRKGTNGGLDEGSLELDGRWRPSYTDFWRFTPYVYGQLFTGYGETLLSYDRPLTVFRLGIGFSDASTRSN